MNGFTVFKKEIVDGVTVSWINREDDKILIHSIVDPENDGAIRVTRDGCEYLSENDETGPLPHGLIVFGKYKWDRFTVKEVLENYPEYKKILSSIGRH